MPKTDIAALRALIDRAAKLPYENPARLHNAFIATIPALLAELEAARKCVWAARNVLVVIAENDLYVGGMSLPLRTAMTAYDAATGGPSDD